MTENKRIKKLKRAKGKKKNINVQKMHHRYKESPKRLKQEVKK